MPLFTPKCKDEDIVKILTNLFSRDSNTKEMAKNEMNKLLSGQDLKCKRTSAQKKYLDIYQKLFSELNLKQSDEDLELQVQDLTNKWQNEIQEKNKAIRELSECKRGKTDASTKKKPTQYGVMPSTKNIQYGEIPHRKQSAPKIKKTPVLMSQYKRPKKTPLKTPDALKLNVNQFDELLGDVNKSPKIRRPLPPIPQKKIQ